MKLTSRTRAEAFTFAETTAKVTGRNVADALTLAETFTRGPAKLCIDAFSLTETFTKIRIPFVAIGQYAKRFLAQVFARLWPSQAALRLFAAATPARFWSATEFMIYADPKDPESVEDFQINWTVVLGTDTIVSSVWEIPAPLTLVAQSNTTALATVRLSGGVAGQNYLLKNVVTCASGRVLPQALILPVAV